MKSNSKIHSFWFILLAIVCPYVLFFAIKWYVWQHQHFWFDTPLLLDIHAFSGSLITACAIILHWFGKWYVATIVVVLLAAYLYQQRRPFHALFVILAATVPTILMSLFKNILQRPRPELWSRLVVETSSSFPSGHSTYGAAFATALILLTWHSKWRWNMMFFGMSFALLMAYSRMVLGVHYPSDVAAGLLNGCAAVCIIFLFLQPQLSKEQNR